MSSAPLLLQRAVAQLQQGIEEGLHYGAQLSVHFQGRSADVALGHAAPGSEMSSEAVLCWSSSVKPLAAIALAQLQERGRLKLDDAVAAHLPNFASHGKSEVTLTHCLTHTAGLWGSMLRCKASPQEVVQHICGQPLVDSWVPGKRCGYDSPAWYILASVVSAADPAHRPFETYVNDEIFTPLGIESSSVGISPETRKRLEAANLLAPIYMTSRAPGGSTWQILPDEARREEVDYPCPAGNGRGPARDLAAVYASLLPSAEKRVLRKESVEELTRVARQGIYDELQGVDTAWTLGFAINCILSGRHASKSAFGHGGSQSSWAFADPECDLAVACLCNGKPGPDRHYRRVGAVSTAVYEDLGLASGSSRTFQLPGGMGTF